MPCASNKASVHSNNHEQSHVLHSKFTPDGICTTHSASPLFIHAQLPQLAGLAVISAQPAASDGTVAPERGMGPWAAVPQDQEAQLHLIGGQYALEETA